MSEGGERKSHLRTIRHAGTGQAHLSAVHPPSHVSSNNLAFPSEDGVYHKGEAKDFV